ncbi:AraC-like DNA-binding protein [Microbacterium keratanolyticum]|uniref:HTH araC/xylS-type domain-containing protein n=1 Tax=Microbacterium keratanolyticum TaxID=67574 RepID=A0A9W6HUG4_9MICO|nr:AraC family transcriptional regulator [Microbacterium keratanolyticum]MBM7467843.1 AraC-like DNA-binding protein [Microbacterium keratanolyticum]GLK02834.1 hypothetical protein GCM10017596_25490 [Microbacterium keratanolyticum]
MPVDEVIQDFRHRRFMEEGVRTVGGDTGMHARVRPIGTTLLIHATGSRSEFTRKPLDPGIDQIDITMVDRGEYSYLDDGRWHHVTSALMIAPSGLPHRVQFDREWEMTLLRVPRAMLLPYAPIIRDEIQLYPELTLFEGSVGTFARQLIVDDRAASGSEATAVERVIREMVGTLVQQRYGHDSGAGATVWDRALSAIRARATDPNLSPEQVARDVGCSLRQLQSILSRNDTSVAGEIRRERTRYARQLLRDSNADNLGIDEIARRSGFGSSSTLRRALGTLYERTPREIRQQPAGAD